MNQADFVEFPYLSDLSDFTDLTVALNKQDSEETSSQTDNEKEECLDVKIENALKKLKYLVTPECKAKMEKNMINEKMRKYTIKFKYLLKLKEMQNPRLNG
jgi:hypothetical protein